MKWIVVDLDGTLCNCDHRVQHAQNKDWDKFHDGIQLDEPHPDVLGFLKLIPEQTPVLVITGRNESQHIATVRWIDEHGLLEKIDAIEMRPNGDWSRDAELKLRIIDAFFGDRLNALENVMFILEDRDSVVEAYRGAGFNCWQVRLGTY